MLWISLYLPELSLQIAERALPAPQQAPAFVIKEDHDRQSVVYAANAVARSGGVACGMKVSAAQALIGELLILPRNIAAETAALHNLAAWACQFTPAIVIEPGEGLLLEVAASLNLFKGLTNLLHGLRRGLSRLGYRANSGVAPTSRAAWLLAKSHSAGIVLNGCRFMSELPTCLDALPLTNGAWPTDTLAAWRALGITTFQQLRALPRTEVLRRFGPQSLRYIDQAYGAIADPRPWYAPPQRYHMRSEFLQEVIQVEAMFFPLNRLLLELEGFLRARDAGVQQFVLVFEYDSRHRKPLRLSVGLLAPERDAARLLMLARERLQYISPDAPVLAIRLEVDVLLAFVPINHSLLSDMRSQAMDWQQLQERLQARLGQDKLFFLQTGNDHRPEFATLQARSQRALPAKPPALFSPRPVWLLPRPERLRLRAEQPYYHGPLTLRAGPERIESGWWDGCRVNRDYYIASNPSGETLWIYREHRGPQHWFLHGLFA